MGAILLVVLGALVSFSAFREIHNAAEVRKETFIVINRAGDLLSELKDAETGQRGFALTGDEAFLMPYLAVHDAVDGHLKELRELTLSDAARKHLDAVIPLMEAKLAEMSQVIELRRKQDMPAVVALTVSGQGKQLMDSIRVEMSDFITMERDLLMHSEAHFQATLGTLFVIIVIASLSALVLALLFAWLMYRNTQHRLKSQVHVETLHLLEVQKETSNALQQANLTLQVSEEKLAVTLNSIGDAVIATDAEGRVTLLNPLAEQLTGWTQAQASGRPVDDVFHIINKDTRQAATIPVKETLEHGTVVGLANHTVLITRNGGEHDIADSCAPIRDRDHQVVGAVLVFRDVTEEYAVQQALRVSDARTTFALQMTHAGGWDLDLVDHSAHRTPEHDRIFGYDSLLPHWTYEMFLEHVLPEDRAEVDRSFHEACAAQTDWSFECRINRADGEERWIWATGQYQCDKAGTPLRMAGIVQDITERKQVEEARQTSEAALAGIVSSVMDAVIAMDSNHCITLFNSSAEEMFGITSSEILGSKIDRLIPSRFRSDHGAQVNQFGETNVSKRLMSKPGEVSGLHADGSEFPMDASIAQFEVKGEKMFTVVLRNIAERKRLDQALRDKSIDLEKAKAIAEKANLAKSDFLSSMSHELRSPLNAILGFAQLMESDSPLPTPSQKSSIDQILNAGWYLLELINDILDLAVVESGRLTLSLEPVSLAEVMLECQAMIEPLALRRGISMSFPKFETPCFIKADRTRLKQVLINLLSNAIKYNLAEGTVIVDCSVSTPDRVRISVKDSGAGLSSEKLAQLFQSFNRLGQESSGEEGTGIGLVVSKRLVELMQGTIGVVSTVGSGSVFWIELLSVINPHAELLKAAFTTLGATPISAGPRPKLLLYVEDNPANLKLIEQLIARRPDMRLLTAGNGTDGIALARSYLPDVILMDINLPGISGIEAMKIIRQDPTTAHIPIVALSANAIPRDIEKGLEAGFFRYLTKPIKVNEFLETLNVALEFAQSGVNPDHPAGPLAA